MRNAIAVAIFAIIPLVNVAQCSAAEVRDSVVRVEKPDGSGGSGVCVDPTGIVLSIKHVVDDKPCVVIFSDGRRFAATPITHPTQTDYPVALRLDTRGESVPSLRIADSALSAGDDVWFMGYPAAGERNGKWTKYGEQRWTIVKSNVTPGHFSWYDDNSNRMWDANEARLFSMDRPIFFGGSGGPAINSKGEVVGVLSSTGKIPRQMIPGSSRKANVSGGGPDSGATFTHVSDIKLVMAQAKPNRESVDVFTAKNCGGCSTLKAHYAAGKFPNLNMRFVSVNNPAGMAEWKAARAKVVKATGGDPEDYRFVPMIYVKSRNRAVVGYSDPTGLLRAMGRILSLPVVIWKAIIGRGPPERTAVYDDLNDIPPPLQDRPPVPKSPIKTIVDDGRGLLDDMKRIRADLADLRSASGPISKIRAGLALKADATKLKENAADLKTRLTEIHEHIGSVKASTETDIGVFRKSLANVRETAATLKSSDASIVEKVAAAAKLAKAAVALKKKKDEYGVDQLKADVPRAGVTWWVLSQGIAAVNRRRKKKTPEVAA